jgi:hypothetical protein
MEYVQLNGVVDSDGRLRLDVPCSLPPGPVEVVVVMEKGAKSAQPEKKEIRWSDYYGLGKEIWEGIDAQEYVNKLRDEWER